MSTPKALIIGSDGSEDIELIVTSDVLRRGGVDVTIAGLQDQPQIVCARKAKLSVDALFKDVLDDTFDAIVLPGGPGANNLGADERVGSMLNRHDQAGKIVAAICAGPTAIASHKVGTGATMTSYPSVRDKIVAAGYNYSEENVCVSGNNNIVTSRGPGTAFDFALKLVELLVDSEKSKEVRSALLL